MSNVALLIGGNQGDRQALIEQATVLIRQRIGTVVALSRVHETEPWGEFGDENAAQFLNRAMLVETHLSPMEVLTEAQAIEAELGRERPATQCQPMQGRIYLSRTMDIDIIFYDNTVMETPSLTIPHPMMHKRRFVLEPLCEIMPGYRHPVLGLTVAEMLETI